MAQRKEMIGKKFGRLNVIEMIPAIPGEHLRYLCRCDCNVEKTVPGKDLRSGNTKSCGCLQKEAIKITIKKNIKHGFHGTKTYRAFIGARNRCGKDKDYLNVKFLISSIEEFISEIGICPPGMELDRINPYDDYKIGNIRWAKKSLQNVNQKISKRNTSGAKGVFLDKKTGYYFSKIAFDNKNYYLGYFDSFFEAHMEYLNYYYLFHNEYPAEFRV